MRRFLKYLAALLVALPLAACTGRVRPGIGVSNTGERVGLDLGTYDTSFAHPVTGVAPGETCVGPDCGIPDPPVVVRKSQIDAAQREIGARSEANGVSWLVGGAAAVALLVVAFVVWTNRKAK